MICSECFTQMISLLYMNPNSHLTDTLTSTRNTPTHTPSKCRHTLCTLMVRTQWIQRLEKCILTLDLKVVRESKWPDISSCVSAYMCTVLSWQVTECSGWTYWQCTGTRTETCGTLYFTSVGKDVKCLLLTGCGTLTLQLPEV